MEGKEVKAKLERAINRIDFRKKPRSDKRYSLVITRNDIFISSLPIHGGDVVWNSHIWSIPIWRGSMPIKGWRKLIRAIPDIVLPAWDDDREEWDKEKLRLATYTIEKLAYEAWSDTCNCP